MLIKTSLRLLLYPLLLATCTGVLTTSPLDAQGMLPTGKPAAATKRKEGPLRIGEEVSPTLLVTDSKNVKRPLRSFKTPLDVLVVITLSNTCDEPHAQWSDIRRFWNSYKDWRVSFVGLTPSSETDPQTLQTKLKTKELGFELIQASSDDIVQQLGVRGVPEILVIDESNILRYRGPLVPSKRFTEKAIEAVIGHTEPVSIPEPDASYGCQLTASKE